VHKRPQLFLHKPAPDVNVSSSAIPQAQIDASRFAVISRLADDLAHELKNPLHAMVINIEVLKRRVEKGARDAALERAGVLEHEVQRLHVLLEALLRLLRPSRDGEGPVSAAQLLEEVRPLIELRARIARLEFVYDAALGDTYTPGHADNLRFAILLVSDLIFEAARSGGGKMWLTADTRGEEIQIRIGCTNADSPGARKLAMEPAGEASLRGLPAAAALLASSGGRLELEEGSAPEAGITVVIRVPRSRFI
jgi:signal transduction histidine kinase